MANFFEELWTSIFTAGPTPSLLVATNAAFAALQIVLFILLLATYSVHFLVLTMLCAGLWYAINWFAREISLVHAQEAAENRARRELSSDPGSDTETELPPSTQDEAVIQESQHPEKLEVRSAEKADSMRRRRGDSSGYVSTDSEWEKISEGEGKKR